MHSHTYTLARVIRSAPADRRLDLLRGAYHGQAAVVVTCGPSLATLDSERLRDAVRGRVVFAVKQAIDVVGDEADFLCFNTYNVSRYRVPSPSTLRVFSSEPSGKVHQLNQYDLRLPLSQHQGRLDESLAARMNFDEHLLERTPVRPWGPGILHEVVFYLAVHLGLTELTTVGWDIANQRGNNVHFYDAAAGDDFFDRGRADAYRLVGVRSGLPGPMRSALRWARTVAVHARGGVYNRTTMIPGESGLVAASTAATAAWLAGHGVRLQVVGTSDYVDDAVPRLTHEEFYTRP